MCNNYDDFQRERLFFGIESCFMGLCWLLGLVPAGIVLILNDCLVLGVVLIVASIVSFTILCNIGIDIFRTLKTKPKHEIPNGETAEDIERIV